MRMRIAEYFGEISVKISRFRDSRKISRFHVRFQVFTKDFKISGEISRFHEDFKISRTISKISVEISARVQQVADPSYIYYRVNNQFTDASINGRLYLEKRCCSAYNSSISTSMYCPGTCTAKMSCRLQTSATL